MSPRDRSSGGIEVPERMVATLPLAPPPQQRLQPYPFYAHMRRFRPLAFSPKADLWAVYRYDDVRRVLTDPATFSSDFRNARGPRSAAGLDRPSLIESDPPRHRHLRELVMRAFTPRFVARLEKRIAECAHHLLDEVIESGTMDMVAHLALPQPFTIALEMMGLPPDEDELRFHRWWDRWMAWRETLAQSGKRTFRRLMGEEWYDLLDYLQLAAALRRDEPRDDLISALVAGKLDGESLTEVELLDYCLLLLVAGQVTSTDLLTNAMLCLLEHPETMPCLRDEPHLLPGAIEEILRYHSPVQAATRIALRDVEIGGQVIEAGQEILVWIGSANRDESCFHDADRFDIRRRPNAHIAFGLGVHYCFGASLARLQARIVLGAILERLHHLERADHKPLEPVSNPFLYGVTRLPLRFRPGPRRRGGSVR